MLCYTCRTLTADTPLGTMVEPIASAAIRALFQRSKLHTVQAEVSCLKRAATPLKTSKLPLSYNHASVLVIYSVRNR